MKDAVKTGVLSTRWKNLWTYNPNLSSNDYISRLPDSIIHDIISRLQKKEAVKTGVLSTRWKHLWTSNPNLTFGTFFDIRDDQQYASFVNKTLARYNSYNNKVRKFFLSCYLDIFDGEWLRFAIRHVVENLNLFLLDRNSPSNKICNLGLIDRTICFPYDEEYIRYQIPQDLYALSSLTHSGTTLCDHAPKAGVSWTSLKELYIGRAALTEDVIQRIFAGAPLLERLELYRCWGLNSIQVSSMSALKELVIRKWLDPHWRPRDILNLNTLIISIPNVKSLKLGGDCWQTKCMLLDASSLVEADLEFSLVAEDSLAISLVVKERDIQEYAAMVKKMLLRITSVCKLRVGPMFLRALSCSKEALPPPGWSLQHCKSLTLIT
ncbi:hypothetical protein COLO4_31581 [Corchorus olitorius]|uniref:F-box domain-containing protein n=1 Tax=Corchorus olitorius TaxID=93759 RepID=A0A1R3H443_9ROSI|nr:hypothetical protein COLO4_31581 [Corchorus olitorius]